MAEKQAGHACWLIQTDHVPGSSGAVLLRASVVTKSAAGFC